MTTIFISAANGTVSHQLALLLAKQGVEVRAGVRNTGSAASQALKSAGVEVVPFDMSDPTSVAAGVKGVQRVFLLTPFVEDAKPFVRNVVDAAKQAGVEFILRMSASGADPESSLALAREHAAAEAIVRQSGVNWAAVRPAFFMDNLIQFSASTIQQGSYYGAGGDGEAAYISTADIAKAAGAILLNPAPHSGAAYELTGGASHSDASLVARLNDVLDHDVAHVRLSPEQHESSLRSVGLPDWMVEALVGLEGVKRAGWASACTDAIQKITGDEPETLEAFLQRRRSAFAPVSPVSP